MFPSCNLTATSTPRYYQPHHGAQAFPLDACSLRRISPRAGAPWRGKGLLLQHQRGRGGGFRRVRLLEPESDRFRGYHHLHVCRPGRPPRGVGGGHSLARFLGHVRAENDGIGCERPRVQRVYRRGANPGLGRFHSRDVCRLCAGGKEPVAAGVRPHAARPERRGRVLQRHPHGYLLLLIPGGAPSASTVTTTRPCEPSGTKTLRSPSRVSPAVAAEDCRKDISPPSTAMEGAAPPRTLAEPFSGSTYTAPPPVAIFRTGAPSSSE